jgi:hypothetical protein
LDLFSGAYAGLGLPYGFLGEMIWAYYNATVLPHKVYNRNRSYNRNFGNATFSATFLFTTSWWWTMIVKMLWPEDFEFSMEDIETRGYGATLAEAVAIHYWGEDCGTVECQSLFGMWFGQLINYATILFNLPFAVEVVP